MTVAGEDVELERGARLGALRGQLAEVLGRSELLETPLAIGTRLLDDDVLVGFPPLVAGADIRVHVPRRRPDGRDEGAVSRARRALAAEAFWEVVAGPHAGLIDTDVARATGGLVVEGRTRRGAARPSAGAGTTRLRVARAGHARRTRVTLVRERSGDRPRSLRLAARRVGHGDVLTVGAGAVVVRRVVVSVAAERAARAAEESRAQGTARSRTMTAGLSVTTLVVPLVSAAMLALVTSRPAFALVGLVGPIALGVTALARRRRRALPAEGPMPWSWDELASAPVALTTLILGAAGPTAPESPAPHPTAAPRALAASGPWAHRRARSAVLAFAALFPGAPVRIVGGDAHSWEWARWLGARPSALSGAEAGVEPGARAGAGPGARPGTGPRAVIGTATGEHGASGAADSPELVVVILAGPADLRRTSEWWASAPAGVRVILVAPDGHPTAWCEDAIAGPGLGTDLAHELARALAPQVAEAIGATHAATVPLADLLGLDTTRPVHALARDVDARWARAPRSPVALVGRLADGARNAWSIDLNKDGPHGLIAGTTGAGKSELLQTLVLSLALTHPPERLTFVLLDHKGGAGLGPCLALPHVSGVATDLEPGSARRALAALRAELREREELCARHDAPDIDTLARRGTGVCPPRILVVVDELRALADDDPDLVPSFLRIAAQGRSLGLHLLLATQRPAGTVSADVRANVGLRVALRVASDADSRDVVEVPDAASLPASMPGQAIVVTSRSVHRTVRCALASAPSTRASARVRRVPGSPGPPRLAAPGWGADAATRFVAAASEAIALRGGARATPLWAPPLPDACRADDIAPDAAGALVKLASEVSALDAAGREALVSDAPAGLPVALLDVPDERRRAHATWEPERGHLHIEGAPGSGRSTTLRALALEAADRGWHVHVLGPDPLVTPPSLPPWFGTHAPASDPRRVHTLLTRLLAAPPAEPTLVLVDGVEEILAALGRVNRGAGADTLVALARQPAAHRVRFALASSRHLAGPLASTLGPRLVFTGTDRTSDLGRGVPSALVGLGGRPGRGVWTGAGPARLAQAFLPRHAHEVPQPSGSHARPLRLTRLPSVADDRARADLAHAVEHAEHPGLAPLGHGGDDAGPRTLDVTRDVLVAGPPGSGRTTILAQLARHALRQGPVVVVGRCAGLESVPGLERAPLSAEGLAMIPDLVASGGWTLVVDDVDVLARLLPAEHDRAATIRGVERFLVSSTTSAATMASRGVLARVRAGRHGVVLDPGRPGSADVLAADVSEVVEPGPCPAGRGALVAEGRIELVQCLAPTDS
ncbi:FtsK/SpoIIIE domain-containing protein [Sanguibacter sp. A247]